MSADDVERIRSAMAGGLDAAAEHVHDEWSLPFIIRGSEQECAARLDALIERHGFSEFLLPMFEMPDPEAYLRRISAVLKRVR